MISSQGGDEGDKSDSSKSRIVMRTHEWKFRVTYGALFPTLIKKFYSRSFCIHGLKG